jgi:hypothetical protein
MVMVLIPMNIQRLEYLTMYNYILTLHHIVKVLEQELQIGIAKYVPVIIRVIDYFYSCFISLLYFIIN